MCVLDLMKFGPMAQLSFETHFSGRAQLEILSHVRDSHAILLTEFPRKRAKRAEGTPDYAKDI